jgi:type I restriction enzyme S subunit
VNKATPGRVCLVPDPIDFCIAQDMVAVRANPKKVYPKYLFAVLRSPDVQEKIEQLHVGTLIPHFKKGDFNKLLLPVPKRDLQEFIGDIYFNLSNKIELNRRMNETLEALAQSLFKAWFVDATQSALPKGWREATIRDLASNIQYGLTQSASTEPVGPHFLRITDIQGGRVNWGNVPYCKVSPEEHERYRIKPGDVLVARTGASTGENIYLPVAPDAVFASYLVRFQFAEPSMARLVGAFMRTPAYFEFVAGCIGGSAQPNASAQVLAGATLVVPPPELAKQFADTVAPFDKRIAANNEESRTLAALRDTLLPKLLSGELRVLAPLDAQEAKT